MVDVYSDAEYVDRQVRAYAQQGTPSYVSSLFANALKLPPNDPRWLAADKYLRENGRVGHTTEKRLQEEARTQAMKAVNTIGIKVDRRALQRHNPSPEVIERLLDERNMPGAKRDTGSSETSENDLPNTDPARPYKLVDEPFVARNQVSRSTDMSNTSDRQNRRRNFHAEAMQEAAERKRIEDEERREFDLSFGVADDGRTLDLATQARVDRLDEQIDYTNSCIEILNARRFGAHVERNELLGR